MMELWNSWLKEIRKMFENGSQIAKLIYHKWMSSMKYALELEEFSYREKGREDPRYKLFKQHLMAHTYNNMRDLFEDLEDLGVVQKTEDDEDVRGGFRETQAGGSGYVNTKEIDTWFTKKHKKTTG